MQNGLVGWGCAADAAHAANGSWGETEQSDADRPMWVHVRFVVRAFRERTEGSLRGGMSTLIGETAFFVSPSAAVVLAPRFC